MGVILLCRVSIGHHQSSVPARQCVKSTLFDLCKSAFNGALYLAPNRVALDPDTILIRNMVWMILGIDGFWVVPLGQRFSDKVRLRRCLMVSGGAVLAAAGGGWGGGLPCGGPLLWDTVRPLCAFRWKAGLMGAVGKVGGSGGPGWRKEVEVDGKYDQCCYLKRQVADDAAEDLRGEVGGKPQRMEMGEGILADKMGWYRKSKLKAVRCETGDEPWDWTETRRTRDHFSVPCEGILRHGKLGLEGRSWEKGERGKVGGSRGWERRVREEAGQGKMVGGERGRGQFSQGCEGGAEDCRGVVGEEVTREDVGLGWRRVGGEWVRRGGGGGRRRVSWVGSGGQEGEVRVRKLISCLPHPDIIFVFSGLIQSKALQSSKKFLMNPPESSHESYDNWRFTLCGCGCGRRCPILNWIQILGGDRQREFLDVKSLTKSNDVWCISLCALRQCLVGGAAWWRCKVRIFSITLLNFEMGLNKSLDPGLLPVATFVSAVPGLHDLPCYSLTLDRAM
ncbi:hypothetical protein Tco_0209837 [Tanacetum coccineum]